MTMTVPPNTQIDNIHLHALRLEQTVDAGACGDESCVEHYCMVCRREGRIGMIISKWKICEASKLYKAQLSIEAECENCGEISHFNWIDRDKIE